MAIYCMQHRRCRPLADAIDCHVAATQLLAMTALARSPPCNDRRWRTAMADVNAVNRNCYDLQFFGCPTVLLAISKIQRIIDTDEHGAPEPIFLHKADGSGRHGSSVLFVAQIEARNAHSDWNISPPTSAGILRRLRHFACNASLSFSASGPLRLRKIPFAIGKEDFLVRVTGLEPARFPTGT